MASMVKAKIREGVKALVRYRSGAKMEMPVLDLNIGGCLVEARGWSAKPQDRVSVKLPGLAFLGATVVWNEDQLAGIAFEEPIYGPTIEQFQA